MLSTTKLLFEMKDSEHLNLNPLLTSDVSEIKKIKYFYLRI